MVPRPRFRFWQHFEFEILARDGPRRHAIRYLENYIFGFLSPHWLERQIEILKEENVKTSGI